MKIYINGKLYEKADAKISVFDHGLLYGDGVFDEQYYGTTVKVCGVNGDGIYIKQ